VHVCSTFNIAYSQTLVKWQYDVKIESTLQGKFMQIFALFHKIADLKIMFGCFTELLIKHVTGARQMNWEKLPNDMKFDFAPTVLLKFCRLVNNLEMSLH
jgi:hypothetical protein